MVHPTQETLQDNESFPYDASYNETNEYCRNLKYRVRLVLVFKYG